MKLLTTHGSRLKLYSIFLKVVLYALHLNEIVHLCYSTG